MPCRPSLLPLAVWSLLLGSACLLTAPPAAAKIGNPIKKAKQAAEKEAGKAAGTSDSQSSAAPCEQIVFDDVTLELTEARLTAIIKAYEESNKQVAEISAPRPALVEKRNKANDEKSRIWEKNGDKINSLREKRDEVEGCYQSGYRAASDKKMQEYSQRALSDPKLLEKYKNLAMQNNSAARAGDSTAVSNVNQGILEEMLPSHEDSVQVRKSCGPIPPPTAEEKRSDELDKEMASLDKQIQQIDDRIAKAQAKQINMNPQQWGVALERIQMFTGAKAAPAQPGGRKKKGESGSSSDSKSSESDSKSSSSGSSASSSRCGYTDEEVKALEKHGDEIRAVVK